MQGHVTVQMMKEWDVVVIHWARRVPTRADLMAVGGSSLLHCMDNPQESPWLKLVTICVPTNRRNYCISWPIMSVPSTDMNLYLHIQTEQGPSNIPILTYYWEMKEVIICPCIDSVLLKWMDVISCWCRAKAMRPTIAVTKKTLRSFLMYCLCIASDDCCNPYIKKEDDVEEHDNENYEIMTIRVK